MLTKFYPQEGTINSADAHEIYPLFHETQSGASHEVHQTKDSNFS